MMGTFSRLGKDIENVDYITDDTLKRALEVEGLGFGV